MQPARGNVLVVDDDPQTGELLRYVLEPAGYGVAIAADAASALARIHSGGIDLVLLDLMLAGMHGLEVCRRVRANDRAGSLPIIMLTGLVEDEQRDAGLAAGADVYLGKPVTPRELLSHVHEWVGADHR